MSFRYQARYCEENVWHLCQEPMFANRDPHAVIVSNAQRGVPVWHQRAGVEGEPVVWDYHVVLLARALAAWEVWDLDTTLGLPVAAAEYADRALAAGKLAQPWVQWCRVVAAERFVATFTSDRSHMRTPEGEWLAPPPPWDPIGNGVSNLWDFVDMNSQVAGTVLSATEFRNRYA